MVGNAVEFPSFRRVQPTPLDGLTSGFGMRPGRSRPLWSPTNLLIGSSFFKLNVKSPLGDLNSQPTGMC